VKPHPSLAALLFILSCGPAQKPAAPTTSSQEPTPPAAAEPKPKPPSKLEAAEAEVARLTKVAEQDLLLAPWTGPYGGVPPWDSVTIDAFPKAFETGIALGLAEIDVIAENPAPATFDNTFAPLEDAGRFQGRAETLFGVMNGNMSTPEIEKLDKEWSPKMAAARDKVTFNDKLFARISAVYAARDQLDAEKRRLVELRYERFVKAGAKLAAAEKAKVGKINEELAGLFAEFSKKVLAEENTWIVLGDKDLGGLSPQLKATYAAAAAERKLEGKWAVVNTRSSVDKFLAESSRRDLREQVWKAFKRRGDNGNDNDTHKTFARIVKLRAERAKLLGYPTHAHWRMADTMAKDPAKAMELMMRVWPAAVARVGEEVADMEKLARRDRIKQPFEPWDYLYYAE
jgi:peptidyl-dipeptidase Dcp